MLTAKISGMGHTLGNLVSEQLLVDGVSASYKVPHPLSRNVEIDVTEGEESRALERLARACATLEQEYESLLEAARSEVPVPATECKKMPSQRGRVVLSKKWSS